MAIMRRVANGQVIWTNGKTSKTIPTREVCKERLKKIKDGPNSEALKFWLDRTKAMDSKDELEAAWSKEVWHLLDEIWDELEKPETEDIFASLLED